MRLCFLLPFFLFTGRVVSQQAAGVLQAERDFAAFSVQHGTKAAFLKFADSNGVVFEGGHAVKAIDTWNKREARPGVLNWYPVYGWMAASGDIGFTTGPWTFQPRTTADSIAARGQYCTIWRKTASGEWKFLLDMGVTNTPPFDSVTFYFNNKKTAFEPGTRANLLAAEQAFIQNTRKATGRLKSYKEALSPVSFLLNRNGHLPATTLARTEERVGALPPVIVYHIKGSGMARSGDLGYVYGTATIQGKDDSYLRIWRREGNQWKLVLEVLPP